MPPTRSTRKTTVRSSRRCSLGAFARRGSEAAGAASVLLPRPDQASVPYLFDGSRTGSMTAARSIDAQLLCSPAQWLGNEISSRAKIASLLADPFIYIDGKTIALWSSGVCGSSSYGRAPTRQCAGRHLLRSLTEEKQQTR